MNNKKKKKNEFAFGGLQGVCTQVIFMYKGRKYDHFNSISTGINFYKLVCLILRISFLYPIVPFLMLKADENIFINKINISL